MADARDTCALCGHDDNPKKGWVYQENGLPVHVICRDSTFWNVGERVVTRFWEPGGPTGIVTNVRRIADTVYENAFDDNPQFRIAEWVEIAFSDGRVREFMAPEIVRAPENVG